MNTFSTQLIQDLSSRHLLKHPFYQAWTDGSLSRETLQKYSRQYFKHVKAFPRYVSATHANCEDISARQVLLENLIEEERGDHNHPRLWMDFATGVGNTAEQVENEIALPETQELVDTFNKLTRASYAQGLGALYAYEHQVPEVAKFKMEALEQHYDVAPGSATEAFFSVHAEADVYHTQAIAKLIDDLLPQEKAMAKEAAFEASLKLWQFLDGMSKGMKDCERGCAS